MSALNDVLQIDPDNQQAWVALLRWNAGARIIMQNKLVPRHEERVELPLE